MDRLKDLVPQEQYAALMQGVERFPSMMGGRHVWNINSTAIGGGVAEMLHPLLAYCEGLGIDISWLVIPGDQEFFEITKRLHNNLHASRGDGGRLGRHERRVYERVLARSVEELRRLVRPGDVVICHDPQTAGLLPMLRDHGATVVWRCHIGHELPDELVQRGWRFLQPYLDLADALVFTRSTYIPEGMDHGRCTIIPPSIDPLSPKNEAMERPVVDSILAATGIVEDHRVAVPPAYRRADGSEDRVVNAADVIGLGGPPPRDEPLIVQVSRWDRLKDHLGVMQALAPILQQIPASLVLAGPSVTAVADDPEGGDVLDEVEHAWRHLPRDQRQRVHITCLPMKDAEENAAIVNALQRHATVVVQKSLYEGFGLTVTEAMWKGRPLVASAVGGISDQIEHGVHGLLIDDPRDLEALAAAVRRMFDEPHEARRMGQRARERVRQEFLVVRHLLQYAELLERMVGQRN